MYHLGLGIDRSIQDNRIGHTRTATVQKNINCAKDQAEMKSQKDAAVLAQVCSGHCFWFKAYEHLLMPQLTRHVRPPHTLEHWFLECDGTEAICMHIFGDSHPPLEELIDEPGKAVLMSHAPTL